MSYARLYLRGLALFSVLALVLALVSAPIYVGAYIEYGTWTQQPAQSPAIWLGIAAAELFIFPAVVVLLAWTDRTFGGDGR